MTAARVSTHGPTGGPDYDRHCEAHHQDGGPYRMLKMSLDAQLQLGSYGRNAGVGGDCNRYF